MKQIDNKFELVNSLHAIKEEINSGLKLRVIIIDSLPPLFTNVDEYNVENNIFLNHTANVLHYLITECHVAIVVSNLITTWSEGNFQQQQIQEKLACGKYWISIPHNRLRFEKKTNNFKVSLITSCQFSINTSCNVTISKKGVT